MLTAVQCGRARQQVARRLPRLQPVAVMTQVVRTGEVVRHPCPLQTALGQPAQCPFEDLDGLGRIGIEPILYGTHQAFAEQFGELGLHLLLAHAVGERQRLTGERDGLRSVGAPGREVHRVQP